MLANVGIQEQWVDVHGVRVHVLTVESNAVAERPPLLLLHGGGLGSAHLTYGDCLAAFAAQGRVYAPDWPGYGESDKPDVPYTTEWYIAFLADFLDTLGIAQADLCGLSMGGAIALGFALTYPDRVGQLILANSYGLTGDVPLPVVANLFLQIPHSDTLSWWGLRRDRRFMRAALRGILATPDVLTDDLIAEACVLVRDRGTVRAWRRWQRSEIGAWGLHTNYHPLLSSLAVPTLLIHGKKDRLVPAAVAIEAARHIPDARLRLVPACGHWPMRESPALFIETATEFLAKRAIVA